MSCITYQVKVYPNGAKYWYLKGGYHRTDGPAIEYADGTKSWYLNGKPHRTDGPAVEHPSGTKRWYLNGKEYTEAEFHEKMGTDTCDGKVVEIDGKTYQLKSVE